MVTETHLTEPAYKLEAAPSPSWYLSPKWLRVFLNGEVVADTKNPRLLRAGGPPVYYFPLADVRQGFLVSSDHTTESEERGSGTFWSVKVGARIAENAAWGYEAPPDSASFLKGYVAFEWGKMDAWFEENEEVFVHARDPFKRIDAIKSSRHVKVVVGGKTVAETTEPVVLLEPGHPIRYYIPKADVRMELLQESDRTSRCPYKGEAHYYSVQANDTLAPDIAWYYTYPTLESVQVAGMVCFFNERVDELYIDGEQQPQPKTAWSR